MIKIQERFEVARPLDVVWPLLSDPAFIVTCVPGAALVADKGGGVYDGAFSVKFGPITAMFRGTANVKFDHVAHTCAIEARGQDQKGASRGSASATVIAVDDGGRTVVTMDGGFNVSGPLGQFARTGGQHLAREIIADFSRNFAARLSEPVATADAPPVQPAAPQTQLFGFALVWRTLRSWVRAWRINRSKTSRDS